jgi:hypothetical protein
VRHDEVRTAARIGVVLEHPVAEPFEVLACRAQREFVVIRPASGGQGFSSHGWLLS